MTSMRIRITAVRLMGGTTHEHIVRLWWTGDGASGDDSRADLVDRISSGRVSAYVMDRIGNFVEVAVVRPRFGPAYLRTYADGVYTDNLLALPRR
jgi:hypothetical protein